MSKPNNISKHEFAFYLKDIWQTVKNIEVGQDLFLEDRELCHRIQHVLRLEKNEMFVIFDQHHHILLQLKQISSKKFVLGKIIKKEINTVLSPQIRFLLPILKKEHFEQSLYSLVELGAQTIQPIITQKSQQAFKMQKAYPRFEKIIIAAAEQSKNFAFPSLEEPIELSQYIVNLNKNSISIFFDPEGEKIDNIIEQIKNKPYKDIILMIGPEGDLMPEEKNEIKERGFIFCKLTPTVLRACQAVPVGLGLFRSLL